jgi:hypothetical protein
MSGPILGRCILLAPSLLLAGCPALNQISTGIADAAPPAKPPEIALADRVYQWNGPTDYFLIDGNNTFQIEVTHGFSNHLRLEKDNTEVPEFDGNDPNNGTHTVKSSEDLFHDTNAKTTRSRFTIYLPQGGYPEGQVVTFKLVEESINPQYKNSPDERAEKTFTVEVPTPPATAVTPYMRRCAKSGVPIPPDWAPSGTAWVFHGNLKNGTNILQPGIDAQVWTWADPVFRGACIVLPRGGGGTRGGLAGTICQSAATGRACFWDSRKRNDNDPTSAQPALDWSQGLKLSELKDASNLTEPQSGTCPQCHHGNNAFLIAPDDPAWASVLRNTVLAATFTTKVEASTDMTEGHPRYVPVTNPTGLGRAGWENVKPISGCAGACHESLAFPFNTTSLEALKSSMPPTCATGGAVQNCYRY